MKNDTIYEQQTELEKYRSIFECIEYGIAVCNAANDTLDLVNPAFAKIHGYERDELTGRHISDIFACASKDDIRHCTDVVCMLGRHTFESVHAKKDGTEFPVGIDVTAIRNERGEIAYRVATVRDLTEQKKSKEEIEHLAYYDPLTGLPNRLLSQDRTERAISHAKRLGTKIALLSVNINNFRAINDSLGHEFGDLLLKAAAKRLKQHIAEADTIGRYGADEFLVLITDINERSEAAKIAEELLTSLEAPFDIDGHTFCIFASIGISMYPDNGSDFETMLKKAGTAMRRAKEDAKSSYCFFADWMEEDAVKHLKMRHELREALDNNEFELHYQPQIEMLTSRLVGVEALVRWRHPQKGLLSPAEFIPSAEANGMIVPIGEWVLKESCRQMAKWKKKGLPSIVTAINISALQFRRADFEHAIMNTLAESGINPSFLELELTESVLIKDVESVLKTIGRLKSCGLKLSIDDFGTGYSSLSYLKRLNIDKLKIDKSFVSGLSKDKGDAAIVKAIIQMASSLNLKTIAEGVEDRNALEFLRAHGCDEVQGYYFSKPLTAEHLEAYVENFR